MIIAVCNPNKDPSRDRRSATPRRTHIPHHTNKRRQRRAQLSKIQNRHNQINSPARSLAMPACDPPQAASRAATASFECLRQTAHTSSAAISSSPVADPPDATLIKATSTVNVAGSSRNHPPCKGRNSRAVANTPRNTNPPISHPRIIHLRPGSMLRKRIECNQPIESVPSYPNGAACRKIGIVCWARSGIRKSRPMQKSPVILPSKLIWTVVNCQAK